MTQTAHGQYHYTSAFHGLISLFRTEGFFALYKGLAPSLLGVSHVVIQFPLYEHFKRLIGNYIHDPDGHNDPSTVGILVSSSLSKVIATSITYPHETVRTRMHTQVIVTRLTNAHPDVYKGLFQSASIVYKTDGWKGFYRGFYANLIRTVPASALTLFTFEFITHLFSKLDRGVKED